MYLPCYTVREKDQTMKRLENIEQYSLISEKKIDEILARKETTLIYQFIGA